MTIYCYWTVLFQQWLVTCIRITPRSAAAKPSAASWCWVANQSYYSCWNKIKTVGMISARCRETHWSRSKLASFLMQIHLMRIRHSALSMVSTAAKSAILYQNQYYFREQDIATVVSFCRLALACSPTGMAVSLQAPTSSWGFLFYDTFHSHHVLRCYP